MIISRTPMRSSLLGGGTDIHNFYSRYGGRVVGMAINRYIYVTVSRRDDAKVVLSYNRIEKVNDIDEIENKIIKECLALVGIKQGIEIHIIADISTVGTGLGGSSALTVGLLNALYCLTKQRKTKEELAAIACEVEIKRMNKFIGKQDQYLCALGGLNDLAFLPNERVVIEKIGNYRFFENTMSLIAPAMTNRLPAEDSLKKQDARFSRNKKYLQQLKMLCSRAVKTINNNDGEGLVPVLNKGWGLKRQIKGFDCPEETDRFISLVNQSGRAGKMSGAGGSGFISLYTPKGCPMTLSEVGFKLIPIQIDLSGTKIIYQD